MKLVYQLIMLVAPGFDVSERQALEFARNIALPNQMRLHICPCDQTVYFNAKVLDIQNEELTSCPKCGHERLQENGKPFKILYYNTLQDLLAVQFADPESAAEIVLDLDNVPDAGTN